MKQYMALLLFICSFEVLSFVNLPANNVGTCNRRGDFCAYFAPQDSPLEAVKAYLSSAQHSIRIATYNFSVPELAGILNWKASTGVKVEYMVDFKLSFRNKAWPLLQNPAIQKYRLPVMRGGNPQMHNKIIIIDNQIVLTGSANYSKFGLMANYENIMAFRDPEVVAKFNDEVNELKEIAWNVCDVMAEGDCQNGTARWDGRFASLLTTGSFHSNDVNLSADKRCQYLVKRGGLLSSFNQLINHNISACFYDKAFGSKVFDIAKRVSAIERLTNGKRVFQASKEDLKTDTELGKRYRVYFSPEDNIEPKIINALKMTLQDPQNSFAYVSTNFITNRNIAKTLALLNERGVRLRVFFDRGRFVDDMFKWQIPFLAPLGFFGNPNVINQRMGQLGLSNPFFPGDFRNKVTIFDNTLTSSYGSNHNKMAVVGVGRNLTLINGSANWSSSAVRKNGENLVIIHDHDIASIYLKEILSQLYVYRYGQNISLPAFQEELHYLSSRSNCLSTLLGGSSECRTREGTWKPNVVSALVVSLANVPVRPSSHDVWAWVSQLNNNQGGYVKFLTHQYFNGKYVTSIALPPKWSLDFKFFALPKGQNPYHSLDNAIWEWEGTTNRREQLPDLGVHAIKKQYIWGVN